MIAPRDILDRRSIGNKKLSQDEGVLYIKAVNARSLIALNEYDDDGIL